MQNPNDCHDKPIKWGIVGCGRIANRFASDLRFSKNAVLAGVASRSFANADLFARMHGTRAFESIGQLLNADIDVIYVATPHPSHAENTIAALEAGKSVLCEKPFTMNAFEAEEVIGRAKSKSTFLMEGMWTRFFPAICEVLGLIRSDAIGQVQLIESSFGYSSVFDSSSQIFNRQLGGGALLDVGVYCVSLAHMILGESPNSCISSAEFSATSVDVTSEWTLNFPSGAISKGRSSVVKVLENEALIQGTKGSIRVPEFWHPKAFFLNDSRIEANYLGGGFQFEVDEVMDCLRSGKIESKLISHEHSLSVMRSMDLIRNAWDIIDTPNH